MDYTIAIPSYRRPEDCITAKWLTKAVIFCAESEAEAYRKFNKNKIITIPDKLEGKGMSIVRNYILDHTQTKNVLLLDDDIKQFGYYEKLETFMMTEDECYTLFGNFFRMAEDAHTGLWGINLQSDKKFYREYSPLSLSSVILGPCMGILKDKAIRFDERLGLKEDYDYSLQVLRKYRKILRFNKYHYVAAHIKKKGGCATYRTMKREKDQAELLQKKWGSRIVQIKRKTQGGNMSINPVVHCPIGGI